MSHNNYQCSSGCIGYVILDYIQSSSYEVPGTINGTTDECSHSTAECSYTYYAGISVSSTVLYAVEPRSCLLIPIWAIAVSIVGGLLIIGIVVIVMIKLCIMWLDYRQYKKLVNRVLYEDLKHVDQKAHEVLMHETVLH